MIILLILIYISGAIFVSFKMFNNTPRAHDITDFLAVFFVFLIWWFILVVMILDSILSVFVKDWDDCEPTEEYIKRKWKERKTK